MEKSKTESITIRVHPAVRRWFENTFPKSGNAYDLRGIQPVDSEGNPIGHIHAVSIDNLREFNGKQVVI